MDGTHLLNLIRGGETTTLQLKEDVTNTTSVAQEMVAFANTRGGKLVIGVNDKTGEVTGLTFPALQRVQNLLSTAANEHVKSPIRIDTEVFEIAEQNVIVCTVFEGTDKPYMDKDGLIFIKNGADKQKVTSKEELSRLLQSSGNLSAEEHILQKSTLADLNWEKFSAFFETKYKEPCERELLSQYLHNLDLGQADKLNLAGALLFGKHTQRLAPDCYITAIAFWGNDLAAHEYRSSENLHGTLDEQFRQGFDFVFAKLDKVQGGQDFNSLGVPEIPEVVLTELLTNALLHRDYFIKDSIKLFLFEDRLEIRSPGKLPNSLNTAMIRRGVRKTRNSILASFAPDLMKYRGSGSGILRALQAYPHIDFVNDIEGEVFTAIVYRKNRAVR